jgi:hypothetical protein
VTIRNILFFTAFAMASLMYTISMADPAPQPPPSICGTWMVRRLLQTGGVSISPEELKKLLGIRAIYSPSAMQFGDIVATNPVYIVSRKSNDEFFSDNHIPISQLGIKSNTVLEVDVEHADGKDVLGPGAVLFIRNANTIVTTWNGGYFEMARTGPCQRSDATNH